MERFIMIDGCFVCAREMMLLLLLWGWRMKSQHDVVSEAS